MPPAQSSKMFIYAQSSRMHEREENSRVVFVDWWAQEPWVTFEAADAPYLLGEKGLSDERLPWRKKLPCAARKWTLLGRPVAYIKVALSNVNVYFTWRDGGRGNSCANDVMGERYDEWTMWWVNETSWRWETWEGNLWILMTCWRKVHCVWKDA